MTDKEQFIEIFKSEVNRPGADKLLEWLEKSDFFDAPASSKFHLAEPGGLCKHSIHVFNNLKKLVRDWVGPENVPIGGTSMESVAICGLLHDVCKANFYKVEMRNRKNENGQWEQYPFYVIDYQLPYGHGEKSVYIISGFMRLTREEAMAIRWHMGSWVEGEARDAGNAFAKYPLSMMTHFADMMATNIDEVETTV